MLPAKHKRFIPVFHGSAHPRWTGGRRANGYSGYVSLYTPGHPKAHQNAVFEHVLVAEKALGRYLPDGAEVHHVNEQRDDNRSGNLVICENASYHILLHTRAKAYAACGHASWRRCTFCKSYSPTDEMKPHRCLYYHQECRRRHDSRRKK